MYRGGLEKFRGIRKYGRIISLSTRLNRRRRRKADSAFNMTICMPVARHNRVFT